MEYYSVVNKNRMMPFPATQVGLEIVMLSDISQTEKENNILWHALYVEHKKKWYNELIYKTEKNLTDLENKLIVARVGKDQGRDS